MIQTAARRWAAAFALLLALPAGSARAGDGAAAAALGFSVDGRYFAFEQYGTESVSGMDYAEINAIDVATGRLVGAKPIVVNANDIDPKRQGDRLALVRAEAGRRAAPLLKRLDIEKPGAQIGFVAASRAHETTLQIADASNGGQASAVAALQANAITTVALDPASFGPGAHLALRTFAIAARVRNCVDNNYTAKGFVLTLERAGKPPLKLGASAPPQAGEACPLGFGLAEAWASPGPGKGSALAVLVQRFEYVMEGADRRFVVVTGQVR
jgi:predicted secreted protein